MPKAKRTKVVSLSKTTKKGFQQKKDLVEQVRQCCDEYASLFVFSVENMRTNKFKPLRTKWRTSRFFFGKTKVMAIGLGRTPEAEHKDNLHKVSAQLTGNVGLMFTNETKETILKWFENYKDPDYARSGNTASEEFALPEGPLDSDIFPHTMEPELRRLGLPTVLKKGIVTLEKEHTVCKKGEILSPDQCTILKLFHKHMVEFHVVLKCFWNSSGEFEILNDNIVPEHKSGDDSDIDSDELT